MNKSPPVVFLLPARTDSRCNRAPSKRFECSRQAPFAPAQSRKPAAGFRVWHIIWRNFAGWKTRVSGFFGAWTACPGLRHRPPPLEPQGATGRAGRKTGAAEAERYSAAGSAGVSSKTVGTASSRASSANQWRTVGTRWRTLSRKVSVRNRAMNRTAKALAAGIIRASLSNNGQRLGRSLRGSPGPA